MILTGSTYEAIAAAIRALAAEYRILHIVTDDFLQVMTILDQAYFSIDNPQGASHRYVDLCGLLEDEENDARVVKNRVLYVAPEKDGKLSTKCLNYILDYQVRWSLSRYENIDSTKSVMVIYGRELVLPSILEPHVARVTLPDLQKNDFVKILTDLIRPSEETLSDEYFKKSLDDIAAWYAAQLAGFPENKVAKILSSIRYAPDQMTQWKNLLSKSYAEPMIRREKNRVLDVHGKLEIREPAGDVVGLEPVKQWLKLHKENIRRVSFERDEDITKGILLLGLPGTGKSLLASCCAEILDLPLIRLDISRLLGQYVGNSESNMNQVLEDLTLAGAPCVLWIDEIEKAYSGLGGEGGGSGVMNRLFGKMLTFMQEMKRTVFMVATANDITALPPEFFRAGRFSQIFSLMLPTYEECVSILRSKLERHLGEKNADHARVLFDICTGLKNENGEGSGEVQRFLTGAEIAEAAKEMTIVLDRLLGEGKDCPELTGEELYKAMQTVTGRLRTTVDTHIPLTLERTASSYIKVLEQGALPANAVDCPIRRENYQPHLVTQKAPDGPKALPQCLKKINNFAYKYDEALFMQVGRAMDVQLRKGK